MSHTKLVLACILTVLLILVSCGTSEENTCEAGPCYLVGDYTDEEARAVTIVTRAIVDAGYTEPGYAINFVHSPDAHFKGTTWVKYRNPQGVEPRNPSEGYRGLCSYEWCMVFVSRIGSARPHLHSLLVHEIGHAIGYDHGEAMKAYEANVWNHINQERR